MTAKSLILLFVVLSLTTIATGQTYHYFWVDPVNGSDENTGISIDGAFKTIGKALEQVDTTIPEDLDDVADIVTVYLADGEYDIESGERFPLSLKPFHSFIGSRANDVIIDASGSGQSVFSGEQITGFNFENLTITGGSGTIVEEESRGGGIYVYNEGLLNRMDFKCYISNCIVKENSAEWGGGIYLHDINFTMSHTEILANSATNGGGIYFGKVMTPRIYNCLVAGNSATEKGGDFTPMTRATTRFTSGFTTLQ